MGFTNFILKHFWNMVKKKDAKRMSTQSFAEGLTMLCDIPYIDDGDRFHLLDVYYPAEKAERYPVILEIHGGGWMYGDKDLNKIYSTYLAARGFAVVNISYRMVPDHTIPDQVRDVVAACNFIVDNAEKYSFDLQNVYVNGDSAGGHLSVTAAAVSECAMLQDLLGISTKIKFNAVGSSCGALYIDKYDNTALFNGFRKLCFGKKPKESPLYVFGAPSKMIDPNNFPPIFMNSCYADFVKGHSFYFEEYCKKNNMPYEFYFIKKEDATNKLEHVYDVLYPTWEESIRTTDAMCDFFRKYSK